MSASSNETILAEIVQPVALLSANRSDFGRTPLKRSPVTPPDCMQRLNEQGRLPDVPVIEIEAGVNRCAIS